jgi:hypothetical protein
MIECTQREVDDWKRQCRLQLVKGWNVWTLGRATDDDVSELDLAALAEEVCHSWFNAAGITAVDNFTTHLPSQGKVEQAPYALLADCATTSLGDPYFRDNTVPVVVVARFVYRGTRATMPWPAIRSRVGVKATGLPVAWCPRDADWMLLSAHGSDDDVPKPSNPLVPRDPLGLGQFIEATQWALIALAALVGVAFLWGASRKS